MYKSLLLMIQFTSLGNRSIKLAALLLLMFLVNACTSLPEIPLNETSKANWEKYQQQSSKIKNWNLHARAAIFVNNEVYNVGLNWQRDFNNYVMMIEAPFGQGVFRLESSPSAELNDVKLSLPDGREIYDQSAEAALDSVVGWSIPVSGLNSWIKGLPLLSEDLSYELNGDGRLKNILQNGWRINYLDYFAFDSPAQGLPRKMYLKHETLALKIVIERWQQEAITVNNSELFPDFD